MSQIGYLIWFAVTAILVVALLAFGMLQATRSYTKPRSEGPVDVDH